MVDPSNSKARGFRGMALFCAVLFLMTPAMACTTFIITPGATADGSMLVGHSNDGVGKDWREEDDISFLSVSPADWKPGDRRPVYYDPDSGADDAGGAEAGESREILGYIDQVSHTYGYFTGSYAMMNEHQLLCGECTDYAKVQLGAEKDRRIFYSSELSNVALERCRSSREAVLLVGELIETYGYYGTGETLLFADPEEAWVIEMCCSPTGEGGLWAAKRIPDGEIFVAANEFRIREIVPGDPDTLYADDLFSIAMDAGWWSPDEGALDWLEAVSYGEYSHPYYSLMRVWRIEDICAPSLNLSPYARDSYTKAYPFTVVPDSRLNLTDAFALFRDYYGGTDFDMTNGTAAGPFGNPYRYLGPDDAHTDFQNDSYTEVRGGADPRTISAIFCSYSYVAQARSDLPDPVGGILWFGPAVPAETVYTPVYAGADGPAEPYTFGNRTIYTPDAAYWTFDFVTNWAMLRYDAMIEDIANEQHSLENASISLVAQTDAEALRLIAEGDEPGARMLLTNFTKNRGNEVIDAWHGLAAMLIVKYSNGLVTDPATGDCEEPGYPGWWYDEAGYQYGPRVYDLGDLRSEKGLRYTGETVVVPKNSTIFNIPALQGEV
jgi:dipeptidase